jgi:hypothetical protein
MSSSSTDPRNGLIKDYETDIAFLKQIKAVEPDAQLSARAWAIGTGRAGTISVDEALVLWETNLDKLKEPNSNWEDYNY